MGKQRAKPGRHAGVETNPSDQLGLERLIFFSDAVFAIAITLLVLEIRLPAGAETFSDVQLFNRLIGMWHEYLAFVISFLVIGTFWMAHHRKYRFIKQYDHRLMLLNTLLLMIIAFIPFPSSIISKNPGQTATIFYTLTMSLAGFVLIAIWRYACRHNLVDPDLDAAQRQRQFIAPLAIMMIFLLSIGIAFLNADAAKFSWLLILPASMYANQKQSL